MVKGRRIQVLELVGCLRYAMTNMSHEAVLEVEIIPLYVDRKFILVRVKFLTILLGRKM